MNVPFQSATVGALVLKTTYKKHKNYGKASASPTRVTTFFRETNFEVRTLALAAKEATFVYHTTGHGQGFRSFDRTSKLVSKLFESKFSLPKTNVT